MENSDRKWHIAYTRSFQERKVSERLNLIGVENYLASQKIPHRWSDRIKIVDHIIIPRVIFIKTDRSEYKLISDSIPAICGFMSDPATHKYAVIKDAELENFKAMVQRSSLEVVFNKANLRPGDKAVVLDGPFTGIECEVVKLRDKTNIAVRLSGLGYAVLDISQDNLKKL